MARQCPQLTLRGDEISLPEHVCGRDWQALRLLFTGQQTGDDLLVFLRLERTGAVNQDAA